MEQYIYALECEKEEYFFTSEKERDAAVEHLKQNDIFVSTYSIDVDTTVLMWQCEYCVTPPEYVDYRIPPHPRLFDQCEIYYYAVLYNPYNENWNDITKGWMSGEAAIALGNTKDEAFAKAKTAYDQEFPDGVPGLYQEVKR